MLPHQGASVPARLDFDNSLATADAVMFEPDTGKPLWQAEDALLKVDSTGCTQVTVFNPTGFPYVMNSGTQIGDAKPVTLVMPEQTQSNEKNSEVSPATKKNICVQRISKSNTRERKRLLVELVGTPEQLDPQQTRGLHNLLSDRHEAFCLEDYESGETSLVTMEIDNGDGKPKTQRVRRMPFTVRTEVSRQLQIMQKTGVIQSSFSPWARPVVMVRKRDGTHRFCVDYREVNSLTKPDTFPLPRIDDLLDQLSSARYFSTLGLPSGYWQIRVHSDSVEKTAFITPQGLFEFRVMLFGLMKTPRVFQRLMERILAGLNPIDGPAYVVVYILVFYPHKSRTHAASTPSHWSHQGCWVESETKQMSLCTTGSRVLILGYVVTPSGLRTNA